MSNLTRNSFVGGSGLSRSGQETNQIHSHLFDENNTPFDPDNNLPFEDEANIELPNSFNISGSNISRNSVPTGTNLPRN